ncbi:MAG: methionyl-tRNA formyltransferase, partial [Candidatus Sungbacteria bacterium]|nr:methionyl-tRNA formyltransferase [Candidatus Sungbacteria bacterium]
DHGAIVAQRDATCDMRHVAYPELHDQLAKLGAELLIEILPRWIAGAITPAPQDDIKATYCKLLTKEDGKINWSRPAEEIERMIRAFRPWPGTWTVWHTTERNLRIRIEEADWVEDEMPGASEGSVSKNEMHPFLVKSGRGSLAIQKLQLEGSTLTDAASFLRGHPSLIGTQLL